MTTTEYTWTPAKKLGRELRFGDVAKVKWHLDDPAERVLVSRNDVAYLFPENGYPWSDIRDHLISDLLVRIEPAPLPESTEAFREGAEIIRSKADELMAESEALEAQLDDANTIEEFSRKRDRRWILYHRSIDFRRAAKLIDPTPTEAADESSNHV